jgi:hypothetical protein
MRFFLLALLTCAAFAVAAEPDLNFTLTTGTAEHSRDASSSKRIYTVKGDTLTYGEKSSGPIPDASPPPVSVKLSSDAQRSVRILLAKLARERSVQLVPQGFEGQVSETSLSSTGASPMKLVITYVCQSNPCGPKEAPFFDTKGSPLPNTPGVLIKTVKDLEQVLYKAAHPR